MDKSLSQDHGRGSPRPMGLRSQHRYQLAVPAGQFGRYAAARLAGLACCCQLLVSCNTLPQRTLPAGTPPLHQAVAEGDLQQVKTLARRDTVETRGPFGWTPLHFAAIYNTPQAAQQLLLQQAHTDPLDNAGMTPLHWAARKGNFEMAQLLLQHHAEVMARNAYDMTPLHEAYTVTVARLLLDSGARMDAKDIDGMTPLHTAPTRKVAQFLIKQGANVNAQAKDGRTPMDMPPVPHPRVK